MHLLLKNSKEEIIPSATSQMWNGSDIPSAEFQMWNGFGIPRAVSQMWNGSMSTSINNKKSLLQLPVSISQGTPCYTML